MHRPTIDLTSRRVRIVGVLLVAAAAFAVAAFVAEPRSGRDRSVAPDAIGGIAAPGDDSMGAGGPLVDPAVREGVAPDAGTVDTGTTDGSSEAGGGAGDAATSLEAPVEAAVPEGVDGSIAPAAGGLAQPDLDARIVRSGAIELRTPRRRFEDAWGDVQAVATGSGGYVIEASRSGAGDSARRATITLRVPGERFEAALERLRDVRGAKVGRLDVSSQDVTQEYVDTRSRLRHDRAVEGRLLALLAEADGVSEVLAVQARLDTVQQQIEVARGRLQYLDKLTEMATIQVSLVTPAATGTDRPERSELREAFGDAGERFVENVAAAVVWIGGLLPALIALAVLAVVVRVASTRRAARARGRLPQQPADPS